MSRSPVTRASSRCKRRISALWLGASGPAPPASDALANVFFQASSWGSIIQSVWSFMLALRARGLGSAWTTGHLWREAALAELLEIPGHYTQVGLFPIAYTLGTDFKRAYRKPSEEVIGWNGLP